MYFCVLGAIVEAMLIKIVFFIQKMGGFNFFYIDINFTIIGYNIIKTWFSMTAILRHKRDFAEL